MIISLKIKSNGFKEMELKSKLEFAVKVRL